MSQVKNDYPDYPVFKGLQKPLEFLGLRGRYIVWAACTVGGGLLSFLIGYVVFGFLIALVLLTIIFSVGGVAERHLYFLSFPALLIENSFDSK